MFSFCGHRLTLKQQSMIIEASSGALDILMSKRLKNSLEITFDITKDMYKRSGTIGNCGLEDEDISPKYFTVELNYSGAESMGMLIRALCHELVHVCQYARRRMRTLNTLSRVAWLTDHYDTNKIPYDEQPWEIEAHYYEEILYNEVCKNDILKKYLIRYKCDRFKALVIS